MANNALAILNIILNGPQDRNFDSQDHLEVAVVVDYDLWYKPLQAIARQSILALETRKDSLSRRHWHSMVDKKSKVEFSRCIHVKSKEKIHETVENVQNRVNFYIRE